MSEPDLSALSRASAAGETARRPWSRRRLTAGVAAGTAVLVLGVVLLAWLGGSDKPKLLVPPGRPDPVPAVPVITKVPKDCGVSAETVHKLTPGARISNPTACLWVWSKGPRCPGICLPGPGDQDRVIDVELAVAQVPADAIDDFSREETLQVSGTAETVTGLGDEAVAHYSRTELQGTLIVFRAANVVATVRYRGKNFTRQHLAMAIPEKTATDAAFRVATDVAKGLGVAARPTVATSAATATKPSIQRYPQLCDTVPAGLRDFLVPKATPSREERSSLDLMSGVSGGSSVACRWTSDAKNVSRYLRVTVASASDWRPGGGTLTSEWCPGGGMSAAAREYLRVHYAERAAGGDFKALTGPGEQAFSVYVKDDNDVGMGPMYQGRVVFRVRNALVEVDYFGDGISADRAIKGAYTTATYVAKALHG